DVTRTEVIKMVEDIGERSPTAAHQALIYARLFFDWALERGVGGITSSPCYPIKVKRLLPDLPGRRQRGLEDHEIRLFWQAIAGEDVISRFLRLLLILGNRRGEVARMTAAEINLDKAEWSLAGTRTKNKLPRIVPLPALAVKILSDMPKQAGPYVFTTSHGKRPISGFAKIKKTLDSRMTKLNGGQPVAGWRLHDLRRTMRTRLSGLPIQPLVRELMIGHVQPGVAPTY